MAAETASYYPPLTTSTRYRRRRRVDDTLSGHRPTGGVSQPPHMTKIAHLHWCMSLDPFGRNDTPPSCNRGPFWMAAGRPGPSDILKTGRGSFFAIILAGIGIGGPINRKLLHIITIGGTYHTTISHWSGL